MLKHFSQELIDKMAAKSYALHAHDFVVHAQNYNQSQKLRNFYKIIATDTKVSDSG